MEKGQWYKNAEPETPQKPPELEAEPVPAVDGFTPMRRSWRDRLVLTPKHKNRNVFENVVVQPAEIRKDQRWQAWAQAVLYNKTSMSQSKWTGKGRMFSKTEYAPRLSEWLNDGYIATVNPRDANQGYKIAGARGRDFLQGLATGREYIPLPVREGN
jgi:hypothetical protein